ncbi:Hypothetical predicted protein [Octopus vulgaris]|uniref:PiggyBac transposable element-derived protein domain-containing protein n=1 Tax=Octopus vulgaris TaxID=6645 RepID=A0AA36BLR5_OCTVU|nr:Hypothetical predicted protein [Octopus vulgaris]
MLCESAIGYVWSFIIYVSKGTCFDPEFRDLPISSQVVMTFMKPLLNKGHCLTIDNYYSSPQLADLLIANKTDVYGTLRLNRKEVPEGKKTIYGMSILLISLNQELICADVITFPFRLAIAD